MKFVVGENGRNTVKNLPRPRLFHHETHMEGPRRELGTPAVGGERLTACATRPPYDDQYCGKNIYPKILTSFDVSTAVEQVVACALVTQRARVRSPVGTSFLGDVFSGFFLTCKMNVRKF